MGNGVKVLSGGMMVAKCGLCKDVVVRVELSKVAIKCYFSLPFH